MRVKCCRAERRCNNILKSLGDGVLDDDVLKEDRKEERERERAIEKYFSFSFSLLFLLFCFCFYNIGDIFKLH